MSVNHVLSVLVLGVLILNGLRVTIGIPPISYWFRSRTCPLCEGVGFLRAHTHTGETVTVPMEAIIRAASSVSENKDRQR